MTRRELTDQAVRDLADLTGARLVRCDLRGVDAPAGTRLDGIELEACAADGARLRKVTLAGARVIGCSFAGTGLEDSSWLRAHIGGTSFAGARMDGADLTAAVIEACDFRGAHLGSQGPALVTAGAVFRRCDFRGADFGGRSLAGASFEDCAFHGVLGHPQLGSARIVRADLSVGFDGSLVLLDRVSEWSALQSSDVAVAGSLLDAPRGRASAPIRWVDIAGGRYRLGLSPAEARRFAEWAARRARQAAADE
ncbi:MAG TPA: pentapeptide repeat-containing protein, partial [Kofleriaceae bacterium]|nr:pentapeptide repeat-containing protein [Kofleriaceae bacterium]